MRRAKLVSWNHNRIWLPESWEVTSEGGSSINGAIVAAPEKGAKFELYWIRRKESMILRYLESYERKLGRRGFSRKALLQRSVAGHRAVISVLSNREGDRVFVAAWRCDRSGRLYLSQLDGPEASLPVFTWLLDNLSCHPYIGGWVEWRLMGLRLLLPRSFFLDARDFRIGLSYAYFMDRSKRVLVAQYAVPVYVVEEEGGLERVERRLLRPLRPPHTRLVPLGGDGYTVEEIRSSVLGFLRRGYLYSRVVECTRPRYLQKTLVRTPVKHDKGVVERILLSGECVEW